MEGIWLIPGLALIEGGLAAAWYGVSGLTATEDRSMIPAFLRVVVVSLAGILLVIAAAECGSPDFAVMAAVSYGVFNLLLFNGLSGLRYRLRTNRVTVFRELLILLAVVLFLSVAGFSTLSGMKEDLVLSGVHGIVLVCLAVILCVLLLATSMTGYAREQRKKAKVLLPQFLFAVLGACLMASGGLFTVWGAEGISATFGIHPALWGFIIGGPVLGLLIMPYMAHMQENGRHYLCLTRFGTSALVMTAGPGLACLGAGLRLSALSEAVLLSALLLLAVLTAIIYAVRTIGRPVSLLLLISYISAAGFLAMSLSNGHF